MRGQWIGTYNGSADGKLMINIDEIDDHFEAVAYVAPSSPKIPASVAYLSTGNKDLKQETIAYIYPVDPRTWSQGNWEEIKKLYSENVSHSDNATVKLCLNDNRLHVEAAANDGATFYSVLEKPPEEDVSKIPGKTMPWIKFKSYISGMSKSKFLFRGQKNPWRLCTSFHRRGRYRINEFISKDVKQLHQKLSGITSHFFDLAIPDQNGAFFNLLQHHGYPTPLLDWSYSPYVAAFFAFRDWAIKYNGDEVARVYVFNYEKWHKKFRPILILDPPFPHLSVMEFIAIANPRLIPQQSVTTVTNIHDIEAYILNSEKETGTEYIEAIDLPAIERDVAMKELRFMGITAGSMFPGIDGVCEEMKERNFEK